MSKFHIILGKREGEEREELQVKGDFVSVCDVVVREDLQPLLHFYIHEAHYKGGSAWDPTRRET